MTRTTCPQPLRLLSVLRRWLAACLVLTLMASCYSDGRRTPDAYNLTDEQIDSISFFTTHHYSQNYNFVVVADSLVLVDNAGDECWDSCTVRRHDYLVVADIVTVPSDTTDSVWVKVARDQATQGWIRECQLLAGVSPDNPIAQFIDIFSDSHLLICLALTALVAAAYAGRMLRRRGARIVHFNDIDSFYPTLLCLLVASSASFYATIQLFGAEQWRHFYYHPSLNPFVLPLYLGLFVASVWAILIVAVAAIDDTLRMLPLGEAVLYLFGLAAVCAVAYVVFSLSTLYYVGYPLLLAYAVFALWRYWRYACLRYECGHCGQRLRQKGRCPHCGALNQ